MANRCEWMLQLIISLDTCQYTRGNKKVIGMKHSKRYNEQNLICIPVSKALKKTGLPHGL